jgi:lipoyl-dependent peroxiredoxin
MSTPIKTLYTAEATAACFQSALMRIASGRGLALPGSRITARVGIGPVEEGGFGLTVALELEAPGIDREQAVAFMERAHEACPYSRAIRGNIEVALTANGATIGQAAA